MCSPEQPLLYLPVAHAQQQFAMVTLATSTQPCLKSSTLAQTAPIPTFRPRARVLPELQSHTASNSSNSCEQLAWSPVMGSWRVQQTCKVVSSHESAMSSRCQHPRPAFLVSCAVLPRLSASTEHQAAGLHDSENLLCTITLNSPRSGQIACLQTCSACACLCMSNARLPALARPVHSTLQWGTPSL